MYLLVQKDSIIYMNSQKYTYYYAVTFIPMYDIPIIYAGSWVTLAIYVMLWFCFTNNILHQTDKSFSFTCSLNKYLTF